MLTKNPTRPPAKPNPSRQRRGAGTREHGLENSQQLALVVILNEPLGPATPPPRERFGFKRASCCVRKLRQGCFCGAAQGAGCSRGWAALSWVQPSLLSVERGLCSLQGGRAGAPHAAVGASTSSRRLPAARGGSGLMRCVIKLGLTLPGAGGPLQPRACGQIQAAAGQGPGCRRGIRRKGHKNPGCEHAAQLGRVQPPQRRAPPVLLCPSRLTNHPPAALSSSFLQLAAAEHMCQLAAHQYPARPLIQTRPRPRRSQAASAEPQGCTEHPRAAGQEGSPLPPPPPRRGRTPGTELLGPALGGRAQRQTGDARSTAVAAPTPCRLPKPLPVLVKGSCSGQGRAGLHKAAREALGPRAGGSRG